MRKSHRNCPRCSDWINKCAGEKPHTVGFTLDGIVWHHAPDIWLAGRIAMYGWSEDARRKAMEDWIVGCECDRHLEQQRTLSRTLKSLGIRSLDGDAPPVSPAQPKE